MEQLQLKLSAFVIVVEDSSSRSLFFIAMLLQFLTAVLLLGRGEEEPLNLEISRSHVRMCNSALLGINQGQQGFYVCHGATATEKYYLSSLLLKILLLAPFFHRAATTIPNRSSFTRRGGGGALELGN